MLNTGLALALPGESSYSRIRRFYQANISQNKISADSIKELVENLELNISYGPLEKPSLVKRIYDLLYFSHRIMMKKDVFSNIHFKVFNSSTGFLNLYRPVKHCSSCAREGFHSELFDFIWINQCPIHQKPLDFYCKTCDKPWPSNGELTLRKCTTCGIFPGQYKNHLADMKSLKAYKPFLRLSYIINQLKEKKIPFVKVWRCKNLLADHSETINELSALLMSALLGVKFKSDEIKESQNLFDIPRVHVKQKRFTLLHYSYINRVIDDNKIKSEEESLLNKMNNKVFRFIDSQKGSHSICSCICSKGACGKCAIWILWSIRSESENFKCDQNELYELKSNVECFFKNIPVKNMKYKPIQLLVQNPVKGYSDHRYHISIEMRMFIFENEYNQLFNKLLLRFKHADLLNSKLICWNDMFDICKEILKSFEKSSLNLVMHKKDGKMLVYYQLVEINLKTYSL